MPTHERDVNLVRSCGRGHSSWDTGTTVPGTACPDPRNGVHDPQNRLPDRQIRMRKGIFAGQSVLPPRALSYSNTGCPYGGSRPRTVFPQAVARGTAQHLSMKR